MKECPLISVIVPVYKVEKYIHQCVDSIINQTYKNLEIILVDDGSPDNCGKICDEYALRDSRVRVIHKSNEGVACARNSGLEIATGEYIGFIDSDDWIEADMYERMLDLLLSNDADLCICDYYDEYKNTGIVSRHFQSKALNKKEAFRFVLFGGNHDPWNKLYKKEILDGIKYPKIKIGEDFAVIFEILIKAEKIIITDAVKYHYRHRKSSAMNANQENEAEKILNVYDNNINIVKKIYPEFAIKIKEKKMLHYLIFANTSLKANQYRNNEEHNDFVEALKKNIGVILKSKNISLKQKMGICLLCTNKTIYALLKRFQDSKRSKKHITFD